MDFLVQDRIENWINHFHVLDEEGRSETDGSGQGLHKSLVKEARLLDLFVLVLVHDKVNRLSGWIDNEREPGAVLENNAVFQTQYIGGKTKGFPFQTLRCLAKTFHHAQLLPIFDTENIEHFSPSLHQSNSSLEVEETTVR